MAKPAKVRHQTGHNELTLRRRRSFGAHLHFIVVLCASLYPHNRRRQHGLRFGHSRPEPMLSLCRWRFNLLVHHYAAWLRSSSLVDSPDSRGIDMQGLDSSDCASTGA